MYCPTLNQLAFFNFEFSLTNNNVNFVMIGCWDYFALWLFNTQLKTTSIFFCFFLHFKNKSLSGIITLFGRKQDFLWSIFLHISTSWTVFTGCGRISRLHTCSDWKNEATACSARLGPNTGDSSEVDKNWQII